MAMVTKTPFFRVKEELSHLSPDIMAIVNGIQRAGGTPYLVGGGVRDLLLERPLHDADIEVHGLTAEQLGTVLQQWGMVHYEGKSFGVFRVGSMEVDWSLPRTDSVGRKPLVTINPHSGVRAAAIRRDLTINAIYINLITGDYSDPFGGVDDMQKGILRTPDAQFFVQDPLRLFRVMQFIGRFGMYPDDELSRICATMSVEGVSHERIAAEYEKLLLLSERPSLGLRWLREIGRLPFLLPELAATVGVAQRPDYHPEGDVFEHTMQAIDAAAQLHYGDGEDRLVLLYGALCHDLGKVTTTVVENGIVRSKGHAQAGVPFAAALLNRMTNKQKVIRRVCSLVQYHMEPLQLVSGGAKGSAYKRLARKMVAGNSLQLLGALAAADRRGRNPSGNAPLVEDDPLVSVFLERARGAGVLHQAEKPLLQGKDLLDVISPGPQLGALLAWAYEQQIALGITDKEQLRAMAKEKITQGG